MSKGFTLIDLVIALAILAIIAAFALPGYQDMVRKSRRNEAMQMMAKIQLAEEKWRINHNSYSNELAAMGFHLPSNVLKTEYGNYQIIVSAPTEAGYRITASAIIGSPQALDQGCTTLALVINNKQATASPTACWSK
ncbi:MAG: hypothetical protein RL571_475 [Pseudomonadota bacterium]|jgi:type IV pilus assembly protein PilE